MKYLLFLGIKEIFFFTAMVKIILFIGVWVLLSLMVASQAQGRKISFKAVFWVSFALSPIIGVIVVAFSRKIEIKEGEI